MSDTPPTDDRPVVLFDWGETLMWVPGMIHDPDRHLACVERIFESEVAAAVDVALECASFMDGYLEACRTQIDRSRETHREHSFADRFGLALVLAGVTALPPRAALERMADALGREVTRHARLLDHADTVVAELAQRYRLGVVSNYPHGKVVAASLERFGMLEHFATVVVSYHTGWIKPHPDCYRPALDALPAAPGRTLMVGDDLTNDVRGAKALGLRTAWMAPHAAPDHARAGDPDVDIHLTDLRALPAHCERLFS
jgi:HAD superfamily hydrolase (TIGR01509 family)